MARRASGCARFTNLRLGLQEGLQLPRPTQAGLHAALVPPLSSPHERDVMIRLIVMDRSLDGMQGQLPPYRILELGVGFWGSKTLLSAVELEVFSKLAKGPLDGETLRARLGLHPRGARDFFDALVALG